MKSLIEVDWARLYAFGYRRIGRVLIQQRHDEGGKLRDVQTGACSIASLGEVPAEKGTWGKHV